MKKRNNDNRLKFNKASLVELNVEKQNRIVGGTHSGNLSDDVITSGVDTVSGSRIGFPPPFLPTGPAPYNY